MWLKISNKGEIEIEGIYLIGASTKGDDDSKIGFFGSGNKYAIANLLRRRIPFAIFSGKDEIHITTKKVNLRGEEFEQICVNGDMTSLTTRMGPTWETWFSIREFYCNAVDEGDASMTMEDVEPFGEEGKTTIWIEAYPEIEGFFNKKHNYILGTPALAEEETVHGRVSAHEKNIDSAEVGVFRKNIRVNKIGDKRLSLFDYNFDKLEINESRIYQYEYEVLQGVADFFVRCSDIDILKKLMGVIHDMTFIENNLYWNWATAEFSDAWKELIGRQMLLAREAAGRVPREDIALCIVLPHCLIEKLVEKFPDLPQYGKISEKVVKVDGTDYQVKMLYDAIAECRRFTFLHNAINEYEIFLGRFLVDDIMGLCLKDKKTIFISIDHMDDYEELVATVFEEYAHAAGFKDDSREFEQFMMKGLISYSRQIASLRTVLNEPKYFNGGSV